MIDDQSVGSSEHSLIINLAADPDLSETRPNVRNQSDQSITTAKMEPSTSASPVHSSHRLNDRMMSASPLDIAAANGPIRVPGTYPPEWMPDEQSDSCMSCETSFTLLKRRHHCRSCGKIFCGECCKLKAKLLYMDNKEARVCDYCFEIIQYTLTETSFPTDNVLTKQDADSSDENANLSQANLTSANPETASKTIRVQGVLKPSNNAPRPSTSSSPCNSSNTQLDQQSKQVVFADGLRPGTDLSEQSPTTSRSSNQVGAFYSLLTRQQRRNGGASTSGCTGKKSRTNVIENHTKHITVCDELGYLPPIVITKDAPIMDISKMDKPAFESESSSGASAMASILMQFKMLKSDIQTSMESRSCPLNGIVKFDEICNIVGTDGIVTFLLLKDFELKVKIVKKECCMVRRCKTPNGELVRNTEYDEEENKCMSLHDETHGELDNESLVSTSDDVQLYWCFLSNGLEKFGQQEVLLVIDKDKYDPCIPRDIFKIYLTIHELALRRQALEHLGNLLFQNGLFGNKDTAGLLLVKPPETACFHNLITPSDNRKYLIALVLQRWEVPWSKVFPMRLLLRLGYEYDVYPYPVVSYKTRDPVYYELGHTIVSILGDFRNFRYSLTHVDGLKVLLNKKTRKVLIQLSQSNYKQFNRVLDSSNNEHVLAWSASSYSDVDGHLICIQNEDGHYESMEYLNMARKTSSSSSTSNDSGYNLGASFLVFSGALKVDQAGHQAKISIVEDGLLIQIQSCTMTALKNAIHYMHHFDIDCENSLDTLNRVEINWID